MTVKISLKRNTTVSFILDHDWGHLCRGGRIQMSGHSDVGIFNNFGASSILTWVEADTASAACPAHPGNLEMISITSAAVNCDGDDRCSVNTAQEPESSSTTSPRSTTRPFCFWCFFSNSAFLRWHSSINDAKCTFTSLFLASSITADLFLTFARFHAEILSSFSQSFSTAAFASSIFIAWGIWTSLCTKWKWCKERHPFPAIWTSWILGAVPSIRSHWIPLLPRYTSTLTCDHHSCYGSRRTFCSSRFYKAHAGDAGTSNFVRAFLRISLNSSSSGSMKQIPLSLRAFSIFGFSLAQFCISSIFEFLDILLQISGHKKSGLDVACRLVNPPPDHMYPCGGFSFNKGKCVKPVHESDKSLDPSMFQQSSMRLSWNTSKAVWVALVTSIKFSVE